jgi:hypothetical protein
VSRMWERIRRRVQVEKNLVFEYDVSPHRAFLTKIAEKESHLTDEGSNPQSPSQQPHNNSSRSSSSIARTGETDPERVGNFIPFKQVRLQGQVNPLRPPIHVETVLIGRALGQPTGYRSGVGFRIRDDGYVEAEFSDGVRKYNSLAEFESDIAIRVRVSRSD